MTLSAPIEIAVRAYTEKPGFKPPSRQARGLDEPSEWTLIFDTETTIDAAQSLRVGAFQLRKGGELKREGLFLGEHTLSASDFGTINPYADEHGLEVLDIDGFRRLFLQFAYRLGAAVVGFNLPFDIARIAGRHSEARGAMRGGFTFELLPYADQPNIRIKHLSARAALIDFAAPAVQTTTRGNRKKRLKTPHSRGYFIDVKTLAAALTGRSFSLEDLCRFLEVETRKQASHEHGGPITADYLDYARTDVEATWQCYRDLLARYDAHGLSQPVHRILSEASIGKAYLDKLGIKPLLETQPDTPREIFGIILSNYLGGRAEVRWRRTVAQVRYLDFKSMYPSVNALMGLWDFVIAKGFTWQASTEETRGFLKRVTLDDLQRPETWKTLRTLVRLRPDGDVLPVRAKYDGKVDTIGLNHLSCAQPRWYTLADVVAAKLLSGKTPVIDEAITFFPGPPQDTLKPLDLFGNPAYRVDPRTDDVFNRLIDLRDEAKAAGDPIEKAIKIIANATSYSIFIEVQRDDAPKPEPLHVWDQDGKRLETTSTALEQPGRFFHPLLATLITGAARLMLALAERRTLDEGLDWVFCDTDSLAIAKPEGVSEAAFEQRVQRVIDWFVPLNPYRKPGSILQIEDVNFHPETGELQPLHAFAISAKRYCLFNEDGGGEPVLRKASAHGLGHLIDPYGPEDPAPDMPAPSRPLNEIGVKLWQHDLWIATLRAALAGHPDQVALDYHPILSKPALQRYGATSPALLAWMKPYNEGRPYHEEVKPFGFLVAFMARRDVAGGKHFGQLAEPSWRGRPRSDRLPKPIAPFECESAKAVAQAFDRETGQPVLSEQLKTCAEALRAYHLSPETKFENGDFFDRGRTERRHVKAVAVRLIGKEANKVGEAGEPDAIGALWIISFQDRSRHRHSQHEPC